MAAINTTRQPEEKVPLWGGLKERFSQGYGVAKSFASRIKSVLDTPVSHVAKNVAHRAGDLVHGVEYALATRINNLTKTAPRAREMAVEPESWGGEFIDDSATLKVIDYHDAKEKLPAIKAARLQREAVALAEEKQAKGAMMTFAAGKIKTNGTPAYSVDGVWNGKIGHATVPAFMLTEFTLTKYIKDNQTSLGKLFEDVHTHFLKQAERGDIPAWDADRLAHIEQARSFYQESGLWENTSAEVKWKYLEKMFEDFGFRINDTPIYPLVQAKTSDYILDDKNNLVSVPTFFSSREALTSFINNPSTKVGDILTSAKEHFDAEIAEGNLPAWSQVQQEMLRSTEINHKQENIFDSTDLYTKWSVLPEIMMSFGFDLMQHPLIEYSFAEEKRLYALKETPHTASHLDHIAQ